MSDIIFKMSVEKVIKLYDAMNVCTAEHIWKMIEEYGETEALSRLMVSSELQRGFELLRDNNQLEDTFEALVIQFQHLFKPDIVRTTQWRLDNPYGLFK